MFSVRAASSAVTEPKNCFLLCENCQIQSVSSLTSSFVCVCLNIYMSVCELGNGSLWRRGKKSPTKQTNKKNNQMSSDGKHFLRERIAVIFPPSRTILIQFL